MCDGWYQKYEHLLPPLFNENISPNDELLKPVLILNI